MKEKNKKNILQILLITAVASFVASQFSPIICFSYSDMMYKKEGYTYVSLDWGLEYYNLFYHSYYNDYRLIDFEGGIQSNHKWFILYLYRIEIEEGERVGLGSDPLWYAKSVPAEEHLSSLFLLVMFYAFMLISFYYTFKSLKDFGKKKTKAPLYASMSSSLTLVFLSYGTYLQMNSHDIHNQGRANYLTTGYGFIYEFIAIILLLVVYFLQSKMYFIEEKAVVKKSGFFDGLSSRFRSSRYFN